jgi:hypothetical protein
MRRTGLGVVLALVGILAVGCGSSSSSLPAPHVAGAAGDARTTAYDAARSDPRKDTVYPDVGSPGVDALHYDLDLTWDDHAERLSATETLVFRAASASAHVQLDLARQLTVGHAWLDGNAVPFEHLGKNLLVDAPVTADSRHVLQLTYAGTPEPVAAPTDRADFSTTGWTLAPDGTVWTMQEPYGAYSWYAVNDQPSDKAFYDVTIHAPGGQVGVSNGELRSRTNVSGHTVTRWHLPEPAAGCRSASGRRRASRRSCAGSGTRRRPSPTTRASSAATRSRRWACSWCRRRAPWRPSRW